MIDARAWKRCFLFLVLALTGCATGYQSSGFSGGYRESPGPGALHKVTFAGNGFVKAETVQRYALYRCAELAKEKNKPYFLVFDSLRAASVGKPADLPNVGTVGNKPIAFAFVLMLDAPGNGAKETAKVLQELEPLVKQSGPAK